MHAQSNIPIFGPFSRNIRVDFVDFEVPVLVPQQWYDIIQKLNETAE